MSTRTRTARAAREIGDNRALQILARSGFAASGLVHLMLGILAIRVATDGGGESDQAGAVGEIAKLPAGLVLLWIAVVGFFALAAWLVTEAALGIGARSKKRWVRSLVPLGKAIAYIALGVTALTFALGGTTDGGDSASSASASILHLPGGPILLGILGAATVAIGVYLVAKGVRRTFAEDIVIPSGAMERPVTILGIVGYVAKGVAVAVVGILFIIAAVAVDPSGATGLDGALKALATLPLGMGILIAVGVGLIAFGVYSFARARLARL